MARNPPADPKTVYQFGKALLESNDLDPVYVLLHSARLDEPLLRRWLLAYWCFYHVGTASWIANDNRPGRDGEYWGRMLTAAGSREYPRSSERRHFRGKQALASVGWLQKQGLEKLFAPITEGESVGYLVTAAEVMGYVQTWRGFGPWISFKVADMLERLGLLQVRFDVAAALYDSPRKAAAVLYQREHGGQDESGESGEWAIKKVCSRLKGYTAPPLHDRPVGPQEAETVLCKWGSYLKGHYHVGEDVQAVKTGLERFKGCALADRLYAASKGVLW